MTGRSALHRAATTLVHAWLRACTVPAAHAASPPGHPPGGGL
ncbi:hypothetical protein [Kitasatospora sp. LaBMicrA B282]